VVFAILAWKFALAVNVRNVEGSVLLVRDGHHLAGGRIQDAYNKSCISKELRLYGFKDLAQFMLLRMRRLST
jgi:hypothetical protein